MKVHEENYKGYELEILQDTYPQSPDDWGDTERFIVYDHRDFSVSRKEFDPLDIFTTCFAEGKNRDIFKGFYVFKVYAYIHSGVVLSVASHNFPDERWDVSMKGFALIKRTKGTYTREKALQAAKDLISTWNEYLSGNVYGYNIPAIDENVYGFYGDYNGEYGALQEAKSVIDAHIKSEARKQLTF